MNLSDKARKPVILLVEDDFDLLQMFEEVLLSLKYDVIVAIDGQAGVECGTAFPPDLIITDIKMPKLDGLQMIQQLHNKGIKPPTIAISGYDGIVEALLSNPNIDRKAPDKVYYKPTNMFDLIDDIEKKLNQSNE